MLREASLSLSNSVSPSTLDLQSAAANKAHKFKSLEMEKELLELLKVIEISVVASL